MNQTLLPVCLGFSPDPPLCEEQPGGERLVVERTFDLFVEQGLGRDLLRLP